MRTRWVRGRGLRAVGLAALACAGVSVAASDAGAQGREPLCVVSETRRLIAGPSLTGSDTERLVAQPLLTRDPSGARFVVAVRDPERALRVGASQSGAQGRSLAELGLASATQGRAAPDRGGLVVLRLDAQMRRVGDAVFVEDPQASTAAGLPAGVSLAEGVLVLQRIHGDVYATTVPASGPIAPPRRIVAAPTTQEAGTAPGFAWLTATARGDGAIALAGTEDGQVFAMRFDRAGALIGNPSAWSQRVGGPMQLLPLASNEGPAAALLGRPVRGTGPQNEQARVQVLLHLDEQLLPLGQPFNTGFAQFPMAYTQRGSSLVMLQWAQQQGLAIATLPVTARRVAEALPRVFYAQPPLDGVLLGHGALTLRDNVVYDVSIYGEPQGALHGHLAWVPPSGGPVVRRDVLPTRAALLAQPGVLPAEDGVVVVLAGRDETGGAVDALHVRCDLVTLTPQGGGAAP